MGGRTAATTRAKISTSTWLAPARSKTRALSRGARGEHVVNQYQPAPENTRSMFGGDTEGTLHIISALYF